MSESSILWSTGATGDGASAYTQSQLFAWLRRTQLSDNYASEGPLKGYNGELAVTAGTGKVTVADGAAYVYGIPYESDASVDVTISTPSANTRIDRIVLRADWTLQTVRITRIAGTEGATEPDLTQTPNTTYDVPLAKVTVTTGGVITVADERVFAHYATAIRTENIDDGAVTPAKLAANAAMPPGAITQYAGDAAPSGWLLCDGSAASRTTYAALFSAIGTNYGDGDGSTTFNVPNLKGKVAVGLDSGDADFDTLGDTGGAKTHALTAAELPSHTHTITGPSGGASVDHTHSVSITSGTESANHAHSVDPPSTATASAGAHTHAPGGGGDFLATAGGEGGASIDSTASSYFKTAATASAGAHTHTVDIASFNSGTESAAHTHTVAGTSSGHSVDHTHTLPTATGSIGSGTAHQNLQPYLALNYIVKT